MKKNVFKIMEEEVRQSISQEELERIRLDLMSRMSAYRYTSEVINLYTEPFFNFAGEMLVQSGKALNEYFTSQPSWLAAQMKPAGGVYTFNTANVLQNLRPLVPSDANLRILFQEKQKLVLALNLNKEKEYRFFTLAESGSLTDNVALSVEHLGYYTSLEELLEETQGITALAAVKDELRRFLRERDLKELFAALESRLKENSRLWYETLAIKQNYLQLEARKAGSGLPPNLYNEELQSITNSLGGVVRRVYPDQVR